jgi:hypothetical protein
MLIALKKVHYNSSLLNIRLLQLPEIQYYIIQVLII